MLSLVIPLCGNGQRFKDQGYDLPKPMIMVNGKSIIEWSMESFYPAYDELIFIVRADHVANYKIDSFLKEKFGDDIRLVIVDGVTSGAIDTVLRAKSIINPNNQLAIWCSDLLMLNEGISQNIHLLNIDPDKQDGFLYVFRSNSPNYSYCKVNPYCGPINPYGYFVEEVREKEVISEWANTGLYWFKTAKMFFKYAEQELKEKNGKEKHIAPIYNRLIKDKKNVIACEIKTGHIFGIPSEMEFFRDISLNKFGKNGTVGIAADHSSFEFRTILKRVLERNNIKYIDFGTWDARGTDYVDVTKPLIKAIENKEISHAVLSCRSSNGMSIFANKHDFVRCAVVWDEWTAEHAIAHNAANVFSFASKYVNDEETLDIIIKKMLNTDFQGFRHQSRVQKSIGLI